MLEFAGTHRRCGHCAASSLTPAAATLHRELMDLGLKGKRALITGSSRGIGSAVSQCLAAEACDLVLVARDSARLAQLEAQIAARHPSVNVQLIALDLREPGACPRLAREAGPVDILINNAGDIPGGSLLDIDEATWRNAWDLKVFATINLTREVYRDMRARHAGVILNVVGTAGERPRGDHIAVSSGNAALLAFTRALGMESVNHGVRVLAVNPGATETDRQIVRWKKKAAAELGDENRWPELLAPYPFGRLARPAEIASLITFLASDQATYVSGTVVTADGGGQR